MHRLGRGTARLVVFARTTEAHAARGSVAPKVEKRYLVWSPDWCRRLVITIGRVEHPILGTINAATPDGREAKRAETVAPRHDSPRGPYHHRPAARDRIHGVCRTPLVGDRSTVGVSRRRGTLPSDLGYILHAWTISFAHPRAPATAPSWRSRPSGGSRSSAHVDRARETTTVRMSVMPRSFATSAIGHPLQHELHRLDLEPQ